MGMTGTHMNLAIHIHKKMRFSENSDFRLHIQIQGYFFTLFATCVSILEFKIEASPFWNK